MLSNPGLSVCLVTFVYCGQTIGWIRMPFGTEVGLDPGDIVLDGDPAPREMGHSSPHFCGLRTQAACVRINCGPCLLWPNGWMDQNATWYGGMPRHGRPSQQLLGSCKSSYNIMINNSIQGSVVANKPA